jgi:WD40 repeat protein
VIDVPARVQAARLAIDGPQVRGLAADGAHVAITADRSIGLWQVGTWAPAEVLRGHKSAVLAVWFSAAGRLVSASLDATTLVWEPGSQRPTQLPDPNRVFAVATSPDGSFMATLGTDGEIRIWDAAS